MKANAVLLIAAAFLSSACADQVATDQPATDPAAQPATEVAPADDPRPVDTDTVTFIQQGRTLNFEGRDWILAGNPVLRPIVRHVGTAEGIDLYTTVSDQAVSTTLFFYLGNGYWQALEETGSNVHIDPDTMPPAP